MTINKVFQRRWMLWLMGFAFWTLIGLSFAFQFFISSGEAGLEDNGGGLRKNGPAKNGAGLSNTRARLQSLYGKAHGFGLCDAPGEGLLVCLTIPFRPAPPL